MPPLPPFKLERYFARYEFQVRHLLCCSDCQSWTVEELLALEPEASLNGLWLGYTESAGSPALRREISQLYESIAPEEVLVHAGAEEAIFLFMHAALRPGDHLIVHTPCYQSLSAVAQSLGCTVSPWRAAPERGWALDLDTLKGLIRKETRAIVVNTPHNPTGYLMDRESFTELARMAEEQGLWLFSDEVYRESELDPGDRLPAACDLGHRTVSLGVMSKTYGLPGLRIGWVATHDRELLARMAGLKDYTTICSSAPSEFLAEIALRHRTTLSERNVAIIAQNLTLLDGFFARHADRFAWQRPKAGPIAFPQLLGEPIEAFCHRLVTERGVLLLPGTLFDDPGNRFRIGFGRSSLPQALENLEAFLEGA